MEVLEEDARRGGEFEAACCIYPNAALISLARLRKGLQILMANDSLESAVPMLRLDHPIQRALKIEDGRLCMIAPEYLNERS